MRNRLFQLLIICMLSLRLVPSAQASAVYRPTTEYPPVCGGCGYFSENVVFFPGVNLFLSLDLLLEGVTGINHVQPPSYADGESGVPHGQLL